MNSVLLLGNSSFTHSLRSQVRGLASLTVTITETVNEAIALTEQLSPDVVIIQTHTLKKSSVIQTFGQLQSAYIIVIEVEQPSHHSAEELIARHLDKTAYALESGADAYLLVQSQNRLAQNGAMVPLELAPAVANTAFGTYADHEAGQPAFNDRVQSAQSQGATTTTQSQALPSLRFQPNQCRLIQAHIQLGLSRAQQYRDLSRINDWLSAVALVDALTQLNNRRAFDLELPNQIKMARQKQTSLSLMVLDIDYFKSVNDRFGHLVGDDMLKQLAKRLLSNMRFYDTPFRYGGEEFVITLNNTDVEEGGAIANRLRQLIATEPFQLTQPINDLVELEMTVSIGLTELQPTDDEQGRSFLDRADKHLLQAKASGRNQVVAK